MACDVQTVQTNADPFLAVSEKQLLAMEVYLLCVIANMSCTAQSLVTASACYADCMSHKSLQAAIVYLLCQISAGSGGLGAAQMYTGIAPPVAPTDPTKAAIFYPDDNTLPMQAWTPGVGWHDI